jgi:hypothetical protein
MLLNPSPEAVAGFHDCRAPRRATGGKGGRTLVEARAPPFR